jgi:tripartite-type tricarboxylate transporter receptor subunit TctC
MPEVPTMIEAGVPGFQATTWFAIFTPAQTPRPVIDKLNVEIIKVLRAPEMRERLTGLGCEVVGNKPEELAAFLKAEIAKWSKVVKESGARID